MRKIYICLLLFILGYISSVSFAQTVFWSEDFGTGCNQAQLANGVVTTNGIWIVTLTGFNDADANKWYISATENGNGAGNCGSACGSNRTLHVGADDGIVQTDPGAAYDAGGLCGLLACVSADARAESPVINCTGRSNITLSFNYIEFGDGTFDNGTLWYYNGSSWSQIDPLAKTTCCGGSCNGSNQGRWTAFSIALPSSANNNPNVKIGFRWINNDDGIGTDPSIAVDDIKLTVPSGAPPVASFAASDTVFCDEAGKCLTFTDHSTGNPNSWQWLFPGATPNSSTKQNPDSICYYTPGTFTATLIATNSFGTDTLQVNSLIIFGTGPAAPTLTVQGGDTITCSPASSYQWYFNGVPISGATNSFYVAPQSGNYNVFITDNNGCGRLGTAINVTITSVQALNNKSMVEFFPNPVAGELSVVGKQLSGKNVGIDIYNMLGERLYHETFEIQGLRFENTINVSGFAKGIYSIQMDNEDKRWMMMLIKQ